MAVDKLMAEAGKLDVRAAVPTGDAAPLKPEAPIKVAAAEVEQEWPEEIISPYSGKGPHSKSFVFHPLGKASQARGLKVCKIVGCCDAAEAVNLYWQRYGVVRPAKYNYRVDAL